MNKKNFNQLSKEWAEKAESYLRELVIDVLQENKLSVDEFCEFTDIDFDEMSDFLVGEGSLSMQNIGKILIGWNLSLDVKDVSDTEIGSYDLDDEEEEPKKKEFASYDSVKKQNKNDDDLNDAIHKTMEEHPERIMNLLFAIVDPEF